MRLPAAISALAIAAFAMSGDLALAEDTAAPAAQPSVTTNVQNWTKDQWSSAKKEWAKNKVKWADCRQQAKSQNLKGRKSWSFLYDCMTTKS